LHPSLPDLRRGLAVAADRQIASPHVERTFAWLSRHRKVASHMYQQPPELDRSATIRVARQQVYRCTLHFASRSVTSALP